MIKPHEIKKVPKEKNNCLLDQNDEMNHTRHPFKEEIHYIDCFQQLSTRYHMS